jgi:hypothetical protein
LRVDRVWHGVWPETGVTFSFTGGRLGAHSLLVDDDPDYPYVYKGERGVFFLLHSEPAYTFVPRWFVTKQYVIADDRFFRVTMPSSDTVFPDYTREDLALEEVGFVAALEESVRTALSDRDLRHLWKVAEVVLEGRVQSTRRYEEDETGQPILSPLTWPEWARLPKETLRPSYVEADILVERTLKGDFDGDVCTIRALDPMDLRVRSRRGGVHAVALFDNFGEHKIVVFLRRLQRTGDWEALGGRSGVLPVFDDGTVSMTRVAVDGLQQLLR